MKQNYTVDRGKHYFWKKKKTACMFAISPSNTFSVLIDFSTVPKILQVHEHSTLYIIHNTITVRRQCKIFVAYQSFNPTIVILCLLERLRRGCGKKLHLFFSKRLKQRSLSTTITITISILKPSHDELIESESFWQSSDHIHGGE